MNIQNPNTSNSGKHEQNQQAGTNWDDALRSFYKAASNQSDIKTLSECTKNLEEISRKYLPANDLRWVETHECLAFAASNARDFKGMQDHLKEAISLQKKLSPQNYLKEISLYSQLITALVRNYDFSSARDYCEQLDRLFNSPVANDPFAQFERYLIKASVYWQSGENKQGFQNLGFAMDQLDAMRLTDIVQTTEALYTSGRMLMAMFLPREAAWLLNQARQSYEMSPNEQSIDKINIYKALLDSLIESRNIKAAHKLGLEILSYLKEDPKTKIDQKLEIRYALLQTLLEQNFHEKALSIAKQVIEVDEKQRGPGGLWVCRFRLAAAEIALNIGRLNESKQLLKDTENDIIAMLPPEFESVFTLDSDDLFVKINRALISLPTEIRPYTEEVLSLLAKRDYLAITSVQLSGDLIESDMLHQRFSLISIIAMASSNQDFQANKLVAFSKLNFYSTKEEAETIISLYKQIEQVNHHPIPPRNQLAVDIVLTKILGDLNRTDQAKEHINRAYDIATEYPGTYGTILEASVLYDRAILSMQAQDYNHSVSDLEASLSICEDLGYQKSPYYGLILKAICHAYEGAGQSDKASDAQARFAEFIEDSEFSENYFE